MIAKLLSGRQKCVMPSVISSNQTAFIAGRQILEGFMIANEVVHCLERRDDNWFIFTVMQSLGFGDQLWRRLIRECIWSTKRITFQLKASQSFSREWQTEIISGEFECPSAIRR